MNKVIEVGLDSYASGSNGAAARAAAPSATRPDGTSAYAITEPGVFYRGFEKQTPE